MSPPHPDRAKPVHTVTPHAVSVSRRIEIRVRGPLPAGAAARLGLSVSVEPADTVLRGRLEDRPALHGVLDRLQTDGLEVIEVRRLPQPRAGGWE